jgi:hypothetical protein
MTAEQVMRVADAQTDQILRRLEQSGQYKRPRSHAVIPAEGERVQSVGWEDVQLGNPPFAASIQRTRKGWALFLRFRSGGTLHQKLIGHGGWKKYTSEWILHTYPTHD